MNCSFIRICIVLCFNNLTNHQFFGIPISFTGYDASCNYTDSCSNYRNGITTANLGEPDYSLALTQHRRYVEALEQCGLTVTTLDPDLLYPDSCFVEDTAVVIDEVAIITNPGAASRRKK